MRWYRRSMLRIGDPAPDFALPNHERAIVRLVDLAGSWVLLYWYPKADTPGCTAQAEGLRDQIQAFDELNCIVLGASFDDCEALSAFRDRYRLPFSLLSDESRSVALAFGAADSAGASHAQRIAHLIDPHGVVAAEFRVDAPGFFADLVLDHLDELNV